MLELFYNWKIPTTALEALKSKNFMNYLQVSKDKSLIPDIKALYNLFEKEMTKNFGALAHFSKISQNPKN